MIDYQRLYHVGFLVPDLRAAMDSHGAAMGLTWAKVRTIESLQVWTPEKGVEHADIEFTYSCEGPQHVEMVSGSKGSLFDASLRAGHHVGLWVDDLAAETAELLALGWTIVAAGAPPADGYGNFAYVLPPGGGLTVELVSSAIKPGFELWWAGEAD